MKVGKIIRDLRLAKNIKLRQLAKMTSMSISNLSQLERELSNPSLTTLVKIAKALDVPIISLFSNLGKESENKAVIVRNKKRGKVILPDMETVYEPLSPINEAKIEFVLARMKEGKTQKVLVTHKGDEYIYVVKGILEVRIESDTHILKEGDSISFKSSFPHGFRNAGKGEMIAVIAASPPSLYENLF